MSIYNQFNMLGESVTAMVKELRRTQMMVAGLNVSAIKKYFDSNKDYSGTELLDWVLESGEQTGRVMQEWPNESYTTRELKIDTYEDIDDAIGNNIPDGVSVSGNDRQLLVQAYNLAALKGFLMKNDPELADCFEKGINGDPLVIEGLHQAIALEVQD